ncbi:hypothetical protein HPB49_014319 [Dermacentor silvarum]|uniref:Uncharacterized protein n=1 Tax=Dermacentor silvarum TaxID=543639 RepID=A0ACB8DE13_DERSI|nr:hypothetical protein HPB49_014319 [Dermacentor silvarum]
MDQSESAASGLAGKRPWDEGRDETSTPDSGGGEEPPTKAAGNRRPSFKPRPTIAAGPRAEAKPALQSTPPGIEASSGPTTVDGADKSKSSEEEFPPLSQGTDVKAEPNKNTEDATEDAEADKSACMDVTEAPSSGVAAKRAHEDTNETTANTDGEGQPPTKAAIVRRPSLRPRPNVATVAAAVQVQREVQPEYDGTLEDKTTAADKTPDNVEPRNPETMDFSQEAAALTAGKHSREEFVGEKQEPGGGSDEPPPKTPGIRRSTLKPRPSLAAETRQADKPPP